MAHNQGPTTHWNCTGCKEDVGRYGIRHKRWGGLFCETCIRGGFGYTVRRSVFGWFGSIWDRIIDLVDWVSAPFTRTHKVALKDKAVAVKVAHNVAMVKARDIPMNAGAGAPQKQ